MLITAVILETLLVEETDLNKLTITEFQMPQEIYGIGFVFNFQG